MADSGDTRGPEQGELFAQHTVADDDLIGFRGPTACEAAGITYRQLDYWARTAPGRTVDPHRVGLGQPAAVLVQGRRGAQGRQATAGRRRLAAEHPGGRRRPARARCARPGQHHPAVRRHDGLRVHLLGRGRRPAAGRPGRLRHRGERTAARTGRLAGAPADRAHRRRRHRRRRRPCRPRTSCPGAARPAPQPEPAAQVRHEPIRDPVRRAFPRARRRSPIGTHRGRQRRRRAAAARGRCRPR